jgi:pilus assembly protein CpaC
MIKTKTVSQRMLAISGFVVALMLFGGVSSYARKAAPGLNPRATAQQAQQTSAPSGQTGGPEALHLIIDRSLVITSPSPIKRLSVADPNICDALVVSPTQILLNGKTPGATSLVIWGQSGQMQTFDVYVDLDVLELSHNLRTSFPDEPVNVQVNKNIVTLTGHVSSAAVADKIVALAQSMVPDKKDIVSLIEVPPPPTGEVLLKVRFAEVDRSAIRTLGMNIVSLPPAKNIGSISTGQFSPPSLQGGLSGASGGFQLGNLLNVFIFRPDINLAATIEALQTQNLLQILAEPNVLTESGRPASFLSGGEFPYPVVQSIGTSGGAPAITIQFRQFGVRLDFTPTITADGFIYLKVQPEVSSLDYANAVTISGFTVPALSTRRVESEMELRDGQSFVIAGLMDNRVTKQLSKIPGLGDIPLLGKIFQSESLSKSKSELLVLVTPQIVHPLPPGEVPAGPQYPERFMPPVKAPKGGTSAHPQPGS